MLELLKPPKSMPQSEESERAVLAAVLLDPRLLPSVSGRLKAEDFHAERHRLIYASMLELQENQVSIDLRTVQAKLEQKATLESAGGLAYLAGLDVDLPDLGRFEHYVEIVKERSLRRRLSGNTCLSFHSAKAGSEDNDGRLIALREMRRVLKPDGA